MNLRNNSRDASLQRAKRALTRNRRSRVRLIAILLVLLSTSGLLGNFGLRDLLGAFTFPGRMAGAVLVVVAFTALLGAAALVDHWQWHTFGQSGLVALFGAFAASLANLCLFIKLVADPDWFLFPTLFGALTAGSVWAVGAVWRTLGVVPAPKRVATALLATTVIALGNFGYQNLYLPSQREIRPIIKLTMEKAVVSKDGKAFSVPVNITLENHSDVSFDVLGTELHAMAQKVDLTPNDQLRRQWRTVAKQWSSLERTNPLSRREVHQPGQLVEAQPWMRYGEPIGANDTVTARVIVQLPMNTPYDLVAFYASAHLTRKDHVSLDHLQPAGYSWHDQVPDWMKKQKATDSVFYKSRLHENNSIDEETRDPRYITVYWQFGTHGANITETIDDADGKVETRASTEDRYGLRIIEAGPVERILWDIKNPQ
ncbi:hypothetical protein ACFWPQ_42100 [Streptomyces sp. NPDC058464]|uniref:hypothetical protein n=1 Tax=Streptomyces sp. NPDC058464 TaxID=3346511 RepID=UPI00364FEDF1